MTALRRWSVPLLALALLTLAWWGPLDRWADDQAQAGLTRALTTFAAARALNGVISVAQGTEVALEPAGVGVTFAPGQVLDPVNDLIEQFSTLMLSASVSFGVQRVLVAIGAHWLMSAVLTLVTLGWLWGWRRVDQAAPSWWGRALLLLLLLRFAVPLAALGSEAAFRLFLSDRYAHSQAELSLGSDTVQALGAPAAKIAEDASLSERWQRWWSDASGALDVERRLEALKQAAASVTENVVELMVVFLLQTLIIPTALLWALWRAALALLAANPRRFA